MRLSLSRGLCVFASLLAVFSGSAQQYTISTVAGGGPLPTPVTATEALIAYPSGVATDSAGNVYFASLGCIFKMDRNGVLTRIAGNGRTGYSRSEERQIW